MSDLEIAMSYLSDIDNDIESIKSHENPYTSENLANDAIKGDLKLALREIDKSEAKGVDVSLARANALFSKGLIANAVCVSAINHGNPALKGFINKWTKNAIEAFNESIQHSPSAEAYFNLGLSYANIKRNAEALDAFRQVEQFGDKELSIEAAKMIGRLEEKKGGCYIATACYNDYDHPDVLTFRRYRDERLERTLAGRFAVRFYYCVSPFLARRLSKHNSVTRIIRTRILEPLAQRLRI